MTRIIVLFILLLASSASFGQNCPQGISPAGNPSCIPPAPTDGGEGYRDSSPRPLGRWHETVGSFFWDRDTGSTGVSAGKKTKREARKEAKLKCARNGAKKCEELMLFENQCAAIAAAQGSPWAFARAWNPDEAQARLRAMKSCESVSAGRKCEIEYAGCTEPIFEYY